ncbi:MAG: hypothetical protein ACI8WB_005977 [Phenylobacterium sp.]|jgi:hypothetical protein
MGQHLSQTSYASHTNYADTTAVNNSSDVANTLLVSDADSTVTTNATNNVTATTNVWPFNTLADALNEPRLKSGDLVNLKERITSHSGGAIWHVVCNSLKANGYDSISSVAIPSLVLALNLTKQMTVEQFGAFSDGITDDTQTIQAAINSLAATFVKGATLALNPNKSYKISGAGLTIPSNITLDCMFAKVEYTGSNTAMTLGDNANTLSYQPQVLNLQLKLQQKQSMGVILFGTVRGKVTGNIEGCGNSQSNVGVFVDGANVSSYHNHIEVQCRHMKEGFRIGSTGSAAPATQFFCRATQL